MQAQLEEGQVLPGSICPEMHLFLRLYARASTHARMHTHATVYAILTVLELTL